MSIAVATAHPVPRVPSSRRWGHSRSSGSGSRVLPRLGRQGPLLAGLLVLLTLLLVPEEPLAQEAICQRHSGVAGCRVW